MAEAARDQILATDPIDELTRDIVGWDVTTWVRAVAFWEQQLGTADVTLNCLEVGAGPGGPSLLLALKGHTVVCSNWDGTEAQARPLHDKYGQSSIAYRDVDVTDIPITEQFDLIVFKSVLGGLAPFGKSSREAMREIHRALKPGGRLLFAENMRGTILHRLARWFAYRRRAGSWEFMPLSRMREHLQDFDSFEVHTTGVLALFGITESQRNTLGGADGRVFDRAVPPSWRYVAYGVATKAR